MANIHLVTAQQRMYGMAALVSAIALINIIVLEQGMMEATE